MSDIFNSVFPLLPRSITSPVTNSRLDFNSLQILKNIKVSVILKLKVIFLMGQTFSPPDIRKKKL